MTYNGIELNEFKSDTTIVFDPPKRMLVCDRNERLGDRDIETVYAYIPAAVYPVKTGSGSFYRCAELPKEAMPRRATNVELARWLLQCNGQCAGKDATTVLSHYDYDKGHDHLECPGYIEVRKWDDTEWHEPTAEYMGLDD